METDDKIRVLNTKRELHVSFYKDIESVCGAVNKKMDKMKELIELNIHIIDAQLEMVGDDDEND